MFCPACGKQVADNTIACDCGETLQRPAMAVAAASGTSTVVTTQPSTKACPFCGEQILSGAIRCKHCQANLGEPPVAALRPQGSSLVVQAPSLPPNQPTIVIQNVHNQQGPQPVLYRQIKNPGVALLLSFVFPGGGQFYNGHAGKGILVLLTFWVFGVTYVWSLFDAYNCANRINRVGY
jgi:TM2 domain-containing membrane protein YozV/ribosomal protein L32